MIPSGARLEEVIALLRARWRPLLEGRRVIEGDVLRDTLREGLREVLRPEEVRHLGNVDRLVDECLEELSKRGGRPS